jgi:hypothetical protein
MGMVISGCLMLSRLVPQASSTAAEDVGLLSLQIIPARGRTMKDEQESEGDPSLLPVASRAARLRNGPFTPPLPHFCRIRLKQSALR